MVPLIHVATETLLNNLKTYAESGESFDIHRCVCEWMSPQTSDIFYILFWHLADPHEEKLKKVRKNFKQKKG